MVLKTPKQTEKEKYRAVRWGSHVPIHRALIKTFNIKNVVELGAGFHSTLMFFELCEKVTSVENDEGWIRKIEKEHPFTENKKVLHYQLGNSLIRAGTPFDKIRPKEMEEAMHNYFGIIEHDSELLFIDCYAGFRAEALRRMHHVFKFVTFHDVEAQEDNYYGYRYFTPNIEYQRITDMSFPAYTGILIDRKVCHLLPELEENHRKEVEIFAKQYDFVTSAKLVYAE